MSWKERWQERAEKLENETYAVYLAARDPRVPWYARALLVAIVAYALSPIDLIPDFIPILGYLDDLVIIPLGILLALKMIPAEVMAECRAKAAEALSSGLPRSRGAAVAIVLIWIVAIALVGALIWRIARR